MTSFQKLTCSGDLEVTNTYDPLTQSNQGRITFLDSFGTEQGQLRSFNSGFNQSVIMDTSGMPNGINFRTHPDQGPTDIGGVGKEYVCYIDALGLQAKYITIVPWTDDQYGRPGISLLRDGTLYSGSSHTFIEMLRQRNFTYGESISSLIGAENGYSATSGFCATTGDPTFPDCVGYLGMYENFFGIHIKAIVWNTSGYVGIGNATPTERLDVTGNIKASGSVTADTVSATTYVGLPDPVIPPITRDTVNNRVGINNTTPANALDVSGDTRILGQLIARSATSGAEAVAVGRLAGETTQGASAVAIGFSAGNNTQGTRAVAVGISAGRTTQGIYSVAVGRLAGNNTQGASAVAIGNQSGETTQGGFAVAIGNFAGQTTQEGYAVAVGTVAGQTTQGTNAVAIGRQAGQTNQGQDSVAVGSGAGQITQSTNTVAVGSRAGYTTQGIQTVAIGNQSGETTQGGYAVAVGTVAGQTTQGTNAVAVGCIAGQMSQGDNTVAVGYYAGQQIQGANAVAIGPFAGQINQHARSIAINASTTQLNTDGTDRCFINPIRGVAHGKGVNVLVYNPTTKEITYSTT